MVGSRPLVVRVVGRWWWFVFKMKIISWNVRGLGVFEKRREVRQLVNEKHPQVICIQETKLAVVDMAVCKS